MTTYRTGNDGVAIIRELTPNLGPTGSKSGAPRDECGCRVDESSLNRLKFHQSGCTAALREANAASTRRRPPKPPTPGETP